MKTRFNIGPRSKTSARRFWDTRISKALARYAVGDDYVSIGGAFTRASTATYRDSDGIIRTIASGVLRDNHYELDPISGTYVRTTLIEGARTNFLLRSGSLTSTEWTTVRSAIISSAELGPDNNPSFKLSENTDTGTHHIAQSYAATAGTTYTLSIYVKAGTAYKVCIVGGSAVFGTNVWATFDLSIGAAVETGSSTTTQITAEPNGWYRCSISGAATVSTSESAFAVGLAMSGTGRLPSYIGNTSNNIYIACPQMEVGAFPSTYIPTTTVALTRATDLYIIPAPFNPQNLSTYIRYFDLGKHFTDRSALSIGSGTFNSHVRFQQLGHPTGYLYAYLYYGASSVGTGVTEITTRQGKSVEQIMTITSTGGVSTSISLDGSAVSTTSATGSTMPTAWNNSNIYLGGTPEGGGAFIAIKDIAVVKGTQDMSFFRNLVANDLATYDEDAQRIIRLAVGEGATMKGTQGTDYRSFLNDFIVALKNGGSAGDCYTPLSQILFPIISVRDSANKVSRFLDCSKQKATIYGDNGYYPQTQTTASAQELLTREDNKGNLIKYSTDVSNAAWGKLDVTISVGAPVPTGGLSARLTGNSVVGGHSIYQTYTFTQGRSYTIEFIAKGQYIHTLFGGAAFGSDVWATFDLVNGVVGAKGPSCTSSISSIGDGWYRVSMVAVATASASVTFNINLANSAAATRGAVFDATGVIVDVADLSVRESTWDPVYVPTTATQAFPGVDGKPVIMFDGAVTGAYSTSTKTGTITQYIASTTQPHHLFLGVRKDGGGTGERGVFATSGAAVEFGYSANTTSVYGRGSTVVAATTVQETWGSFYVKYSGSSSIITRNGATIVTGNMGTTAVSNTFIRLGSNSNGGTFHNGPFAYSIFAANPLTDEQVAHINNTINTFFPSIT